MVVTAEHTQGENDMMEAGKQDCLVIAWDEIGGDPQFYGELKLTRGHDDTLVDELRKQVYEDEAECDGEEDMGDAWELVAVGHTPRVTLIEFKSSRGHLATAQVLWQ